MTSKTKALSGKTAAPVPPPRTKAQSNAIFTQASCVVTPPANQSGEWLGSRFSVAPLPYYRLELAAKAAAHSFVALRFYDKHNSLISADNYDRITAHKDFVSYENYFQPPAGAVAAELLFVAPPHSVLHARNITIKKVSPKQTYKWITKKLTSLVALPLPQEPSVRRCLPRTWRALRTEQTLRVILLGDSIVNDLGNGLVGLQLGARFAGANIQIIPSVAACGNCTRYRQPSQFRAMVKEHNPDLVVIGGISHHYNVDAIRDVIKLIGTQTKAETLVITGAVQGEMSRREHLLASGLSATAVATKVREFAERMRQLPATDKVAFFDLQRCWEEWLTTAGYPTSFLLRDATHANHLGKFAMAHIIASLLSS